jgi:hypothetical protein
VSTDVARQPSGYLRGRWAPIGSREPVWGSGCRDYAEINAWFGSTPLRASLRPVTCTGTVLGWNIVNHNASIFGKVVRVDGWVPHSVAFAAWLFEQQGPSLTGLVFRHFRTTRFALPVKRCACSRFRPIRRRVGDRVRAAGWVGRRSRWQLHWPLDTSCDVRTLGAGGGACGRRSLRHPDYKWGKSRYK